MFELHLTRRRLLTAAAVAPLIATTNSAIAQESTPVPKAPVLPPLPDAAARPEGALSVVATTPILADIARQVGGARTEAASILPVNADAHDFEPAPEDIVKIEEADLVIEHGLELDSWASDLVETAGAEHVVVATDDVTLLPSDEEEFSAGDPHVWFDPTNVKVMAANIAASLTALDPAGQTDYEARLNAYGGQLDALDQWIAAQIATIPEERRKLVTNHDAFGYYVNRYGLTFVGSVIPSIDSRAEPSAKEIAELIARIEAENVPAIFTESTINPELEEELASQAGATVSPDLYSDNLGEEGSGAETYIGMMVTNTLIIVSALRPA
jgi:zinc/manganese transport system substrate-binding protein/manganese/iron transport system substrate-binding protein